MNSGQPPEPFQIHPELDETLDRVMDLDRSFFAANPGAVVHLRPMPPEERILEQITGHPLIPLGPLPADRSLWWTASIDINRAKGHFSNPDGRGLRVKFSSPRPPVDPTERARFEAATVRFCLAVVDAIKAENLHMGRHSRRAGGGRGFTARGGL